MASNISVDKKLAERIVKTLGQQKAEDIGLYDVRKKIPYTDFIIIATANSGTHAKALAKYVLKYTKDLNIQPLHQTKRLNNDCWILLDYGELIVHIFQEALRVKYSLEEIYEKAIGSP